MLSDDSVAPIIYVSTSKAVFPEVKALTGESMEGGEEELPMYERSTTGSLSSSTSLDAKTDHEGKRVGARNCSSRDLYL